LRRSGFAFDMQVLADPHPSCETSGRWLHRYAWLTALATLCLVGIGGLVTSHGVGMAVPDWPTTYGYNMFLFPFSRWVGGIFYEHSHRLVATVVGLLVVGLTRWLGGSKSRLPLAITGLVEILGGVGLLRLGPEFGGAGHFLSGIGVVVLLAGVIWVRNEPAKRPLPVCGWLAFGLVQFQGLLGGLRVVLFKDHIGILHAALAQIFFTLLCVIVLFCSPWWRNSRSAAPHLSSVAEGSFKGKPFALIEMLFVAATLLIFGQLVLGATMRHQHAGLAIPDFPLAYGKIWPPMDPASVNLYNQHRIEVTALNPITAAQIALQMIHRIVAILIFCALGLCTFLVRRRFEKHSFLAKLSLLWFGLISTQVVLGAVTIWSNKAADIATVHVLVGALSLALGTISCIICSRDHSFARNAAAVPDSCANLAVAVPFAPQPSAASGLK